ncbi:LysR family transcriptional regulator [Marinobacter nanhaiticus D15-8W]|uniref:LysR family transcriptional regulator n=1 Tax=Marinobacter nanhaiticus D15-8W TaxID=626887 RepID=N6W1M5_9GAMM|nr:LysR family transcriptional regulator [Marinobacter nanhaiticus]ENO14009.1 LysR family transcriptional regulator [Marinobacter nanhaiticus D15-8W]BES71387.1 LysR family transcriptional regulator [Marinobacter nanhaiticus D15-8W]
MVNHHLDDLAVFVAVGREGNFTRAAAHLGVSPSAVSQTVRSLEERLGVRLLTRTTRSVTRTEAGEKLWRSIAPLLDQIDEHLSAVADYREHPAGTVRITADEFAVRFILWPKLKPLLDTYPEITIELTTDYGLTDIVAERFDAGVRVGGVIANDMIAMPIAPRMRLVTVASADYLARHAAPRTPAELTGHRCINLRLPTQGGLYPWEFGSGEHEFRVRVDGPLIMNSVLQILQGAIEGVGLAQLPNGLVQDYLDRGELVEVLREWSEPFEGYHLYYPNRQQTAAFRVVLDALKSGAIQD